MDFGLAITSTKEVKKQDEITQDLSDQLSFYFSNKHYGVGLTSYTIGVVCVSEEFMPFFKKKPPRYIKDKRTTYPHGIPFDIDHSLEYSINMDFKEFINADADTTKKMLAEKILEADLNLKLFYKKIKDFDASGFSNDLENFFKKENLI